MRWISAEPTGILCGIGLIWLYYALIDEQSLVHQVISNYQAKFLNLPDINILH